jgi:purine-binding chemotaxis protein CheW
MAVQQLVKFHIADEVFGIEIKQIFKILKPQEIFKVPNTPPFIEGLLNLRGQVLTVFNLRKRFNMPEKVNDENTKILIINQNDLLRATDDRPYKMSKEDRPLYSFYI